MRVAYFWYTEWPEAAAALPPAAERAYTGPGTGGYWRELAARWTGETGLVCIEQDVLIHDTVIEQFAECPEHWCAFGWPVREDMLSFWWLGCTKFSAWLQQQVPVDQLCQPNPPEVCAACGDVPCHRHLDTILQPVMEVLDTISPHKHWPLIRHLRAERTV